MIAFFSNVRPFSGEFDAIQRAAIASWMAIPGAQAIVTGDVDGAAEFARSVGVEHVPGVAVNAEGQELVRDIWRIGIERARHEWICALNADNVVDDSMVRALPALETIERPLVVGRRLNVVLGQPGRGVLMGPQSVDWFLFRKGTIPVEEMPDYAIGRGRYDNWMVLTAINRWAMTVIDATDDVVVRHLNHREKHGLGAGNQALFERDGHALTMGRTDCAPWVLSGGIVRRRRGAV